MLPGVILVMIQTYIQLRFKFRNISDLQFKDSPEVEELRHEIHVWKRAAASLSAYSKDEELVRQTLMKKVNRLKRSLKKRMTAVIEPAPNYQQTLANLQAKVSGIKKNSQCELTKCCLPPHAVPHSEQTAAYQVLRCIVVCHQFVLPALGAGAAASVAGLDCTTGCHISDNIS